MNPGYDYVSCDQQCYNTLQNHTRPMCQVIRPGDVFQLFSEENELRLTFAVVGINSQIKRWLDCRVLVLDAVCHKFRTIPGMTTYWMFDCADPEWHLLKRIA